MTDPSDRILVSHEYLAGLVEGEGCWTLAGNGYPQFTLAMTDQDIIVRAAEAFDATPRVHNVKQNARRGRQVLWCICGVPLGRRVAQAVYPWMGERRSARIREFYHDLDLPHQTEERSLAWAAGLVEGEGCWSLDRGRPRFELTTTDEDVIGAFADLFSVEYRAKSKSQRHPDWKQAWRLWGTQLGRDLAVDLYPWLGERRRARLEEFYPDLELSWAN
jgi:hypothetical protein